MRRPLLALSTICALLAACGGANEPSSRPGPGAETGGNDGGTTASDIVPSGDAPGETELTGRYRLSSTVDLASAGILPNTASDSIRALSKFEETPSQAIAELLSAANVPVLATLLDLLPGPLKTPIFGWIDQYLFERTFEGVPATRQIAGIVSDIGALVTAFELVSDLDVRSTAGADAGATARTIGSHRANGIAFTVDGSRLLVDSPELVSQIPLADNLPIDVARFENPGANTPDGQLTISDHTLDVPFGAFAVRGLDLLVEKRTKAPNLRAGLGAIVDCAGLARSVSERCIGPICVGHQSEIATVCERGLDAIAEDTRKPLAMVLLVKLRLAAGEARMWDAAEPNGALDRKIDRIDQGQWTSFIDPGSGTERPVASTFSGQRIVP